MSHTLYTTEALVLRVFNQGEADRAFVLYTKEFGRIAVRARGIRLLKSKLRYCLQSHSYALVTLVKGRSDWRLINAQPLGVSQVNTQSQSCRALSLRIISLVDRLIQGEFHEPELFSFIRTSLEECENYADMTVFSEYVTLSLLWKLGYISLPKGHDDTLLLSSPAEETMLEFVSAFPNASTFIKNALEHSHL